MNILLISPHAPPKNTAESIQVARYLSELDKDCNITLVTTPIEKDCPLYDAGSQLVLTNTDVITLVRPYHKFLQRLLESGIVRQFLIPDAEFWLSWKVAEVVKRLKNTPDVIYSRSTPFSSALIALKLKAILDVPWIMHLSDPWSDSPYRHLYWLQRNRDQNLERKCFESANAISVTTIGLARYYREKYPERAENIFVLPNVMPNVRQESTSEKDGQLKIIYTGSLYGKRKPTDILNAICLIAKENPAMAKCIKLDYYGGITPEILQEINDYKLSQVTTCGEISYSQMLNKQAVADIALSIEPDGSHPLLKTFLPSKILDYVAARKPILAITPEGSETWQLCNQGYGWAFRPGDIEGIAKLLKDITIRVVSNANFIDKNLPLPPAHSPLEAANVLLKRIKLLLNEVG